MEEVERAGAIRRAVRRAVEPLARSRLGGWWFLKVTNRADKVLVPLTRGRFSLSGLGISPVGVLKTIGAKTGAERQTPLTYVADGERIVLIASKAGAPKHPAWYHNLRANPDVGFVSKRGDLRYRAHTAEGEERERLWAKANRLYGGYETYQDRATEAAREIPVVVLEPEA
jgi:deazaflavin-dependent oxidoreductase (nitroreductase family)